MTVVDVLNDSFWADRELEVQNAEELRRGSVTKDEAFWQPSVGSTETEVIWDKARQDASEVVSRKLLAGEAIQSLEIARMTANNLGIDLDTEGVYRDASGAVLSVGMIIYFNEGMINRMAEGPRGRRMSALDGFDGNLTPDIVDRDFPLQQPDGRAETIKQMIADGNQDEAELLFRNLHAADQGTVEVMADEILVDAGFSPSNLDVLRALRLGIWEGLKRGRQEGANVVREIRAEGDT